MFFIPGGMSGNPWEWVGIPGNEQEFLGIFQVE